ncbi:HAD-IA family hydrolase [Leptolyngbya iicbica]|uniref:HAD family hydrolase n=2 Tax=Cyanophyceae TaxID=3028117 RepID=A0A4Q7E8V1_9CYAN|nr:HAD-IA family hydrolase [Leptolyngbya sp. LK]RZM78824.1 HAD family hydrolase [Leptolyngbya sp. LK]
MTTLQALIFDVDGTLAETERDGHRVAFNQAFAAAGLPWYWSEGIYGVLLQVAGGKERIHFFIDKYAPPLPSDRDLDDLIAELHHAKTGYYTALLQAGQISLRPGIKRLINEARQQNVRLAIATTSRLENALALLETALAPDAPSWFEVIAAGDIVPRKKPAADIYHYVLDKMALDAQNCLVIEDTEHGLTAAQGAGLTTVITVNEYTKRQNFAAAALVLNHLGKPDQPCESLWGHFLTQPYFDLSVARSLVSMTEPANASCVVKRLREGD